MSLTKIKKNWSITITQSINPNYYNAVFQQLNQTLIFKIKANMTPVEAVLIFEKMMVENSFPDQLIISIATQDTLLENAAIELGIEPVQWLTADNITGKRK
jgi:hypothetical protein